MDRRELRRCLGRFATGVCVVTYRANGEPRGVTINAFTSVSLEPPLVLVSIDRRARACELLQGTPFGVNVLAADQLDVALHFAGQPTSSLDLRWAVDGAVPRLLDAIAWMECDPWRSYDGGDHVLYLGLVKRFAHREGEPLLFYGGGFRMVGVAVLRSPKMVLLGDRPIPKWLEAACRLHDHVPSV